MRDKIGQRTDPEAMRRLRAVEAATRRLIHRRYGNWKHDRDELESRVLDKYFVEWGRGAGPDNVEGWLAKVMARTAIDIDRADRGEIAIGLGGDNNDASVAGSDARGFSQRRRTSYGVLDDDVWERIFVKLANPRAETLLRYKFREGLTAADIAKREDRNVEAVRKAIQRAQKSLTQVLADNPALEAELRAGDPHID